MKKIILIVLLVIMQNSFSQKIDGICYESDYFGESINEVEYLRYSENSIKERYLNFTEVKNTTPKELVKSMMSAKTNEWVSFNYGQDMNWTQEQLNRLSDPNKYVELLCEINFVINKERYSIVKLNLFDGDKKPQFLSLVLKKVKDRWIINSDATLNDLNFLIMFISIDDIDAIFKNTSTNNDKLNNIIKSSWNKNTLNLSKIISDLGSMMINQEYKTLPTVNTENSSKEKNKVIPVIYNYPLLNQKFCYYFPNEISNYNEQELDEILTFIKGKQVEQTNITPIHRFSYQRDNKTIIVFKYLLKSSSNEELKSEHFTVNNSIVSLYKTDNYIEENVFNIVKSLKSEAIIQFSNGDNNSNYSEINKLKPLVKDSKSILNIEKLAQILKENRSTLSKYLED